MNDSSSHLPDANAASLAQQAAHCIQRLPANLCPSSHVLSSLYCPAQDSSAPPPLYRANSHLASWLLQRARVSGCHQADTTLCSSYAAGRARSAWWPGMWWCGERCRARSCLEERRWREGLPGRASSRTLRPEEGLSGRCSRAKIGLVMWCWRQRSNL